MNSENEQIIKDMVTDLEVIRVNCDEIELDHASIIKVVEAKSDIYRAIQKLNKILVGLE